MKLIKNLVNIKTPSNLYSLWNIGSLISLMIMFQIIFGLILSMNYFNNFNPFISSFNIYYNINFGWLMRIIHSNLTSMIFILILFHLKRNLMFKTLMNLNMWMTGMLMFLMMMMISFFGYSLIWNQMSYWAMMVITNFLSSIPLLGKLLIKWIWGNFNINIILINRFFSIHFLLPLIILMMTMIHLMILHYNKSSNPLGMNNKLDLINLNPMLLFKDLYFFILILMIFINLILINPNLFNNYDNFNMMNYFKTPNHIEPEWYFLFFYSILRSIENKLSGLILVLISIILILFLPYFLTNKFQSNKFIPMMKISLWIFFNIIISISYLGTKIMEFPFNMINLILIMMFFFMINFMYLINKF